MRATPWLPSVMSGNLPALPGAGLNAHGLQYDGHKPSGDLLAGRDHGVVFARVVLRMGLARPGDELVGVPGHGGDGDGDPVARIHLALHMPGGIPDTFDIGDGRSAKLHHEEHLCSYAGKSGVKKPLAALASPRKQEGHRWRLRQKHGGVHPWTKKNCAASRVWPASGGTSGAGSRALHAINPARLAFIVEEVKRWRGEQRTSFRPLEGLSVIDIGCGGGILSEPMTRLGAAVTGIDPIEESAGVARAHAQGAGLSIAYRTATAEDIAREGLTFDAVVASEVVEHVADLGSFLMTCRSLCKPGGLLILSTLNRTAKSYGLAVSCGGARAWARSSRYS